MRSRLTVLAVALLLAQPFCGAGNPSIKAGSRYSVVMLGDTHFDTEPAEVYHSNYNEPVEWLNRVQRQEFARNGEMWRERCPRMIARAAGLVRRDTKFIYQTGDLIQGDCGNGEVHRRMLEDVMDSFKKSLGGLPFVTVTGNHDVRGTDAAATYRKFMPERLSGELGAGVERTCFAFFVGPDAYVAIDFNKPDKDELDRLLAETEGARHTFILCHAPVFPYDAENCRWFLYGSDRRKAERDHFIAEFARRNAIVLCGHTHSTEFADWQGKGGRITQMTMSSVWSKESKGVWSVNSEGPESYGSLRGRMAAMPDGKPIKDESAIFDEYRSGLVSYVHSPSAGSYRMTVSPRRIVIDFYAGDSRKRSERFVIRQATLPGSLSSR